MGGSVATYGCLCRMPERELIASKLLPHIPVAWLTFGSLYLAIFGVLHCLPPASRERLWEWGAKRAHWQVCDPHSVVLVTETDA